MSALSPSAPLLAKLGSIIVHFEEFQHSHHAFDLLAAQQLLSDPEVEAWLKEMDGLSLLPVKR